MRKVKSRTSTVMTRRREWRFRIVIEIVIVDRAEVEEAAVVVDGVVVDAGVTTAAAAGTVDTAAEDGSTLLARAIEL